jgi:hypothetical protein
MLRCETVLVTEDLGIEQPLPMRPCGHGSHFPGADLVSVIQSLDGSRVRLRWSTQTWASTLTPPLEPTPYFARGLGVVAGFTDALAVRECVGAAFGDGGAVVGDDGGALAADAAGAVAAQNCLTDGAGEVFAPGPVSHRRRGARR